MGYPLNPPTAPRLEAPENRSTDPSGNLELNSLISGGGVRSHRSFMPSGVYARHYGKRTEIV